MNIKIVRFNSFSTLSMNSKKGGAQWIQMKNNIHVIFQCDTKKNWKNEHKKTVYVERSSEIRTKETNTHKKTHKHWIGLENAIVSIFGCAWYFNKFQAIEPTEEEKKYETNMPFFCHKYRDKKKKRVNLLYEHRQRDQCRKTKSQTNRTMTKRSWKQTQSTPKRHMIGNERASEQHDKHSFDIHKRIWSTNCGFIFITIVRQCKQSQRTSVWKKMGGTNAHYSFALIVSFINCH